MRKYFNFCIAPTKINIWVMSFKFCSRTDSIYKCLAFNEIFKFQDFIESQKFVNNVGAIAEHEGHHPDIYFGWGYAKIKIFTHAIKGLAESDFILAAKIDQL